jgi:hypothetical protein
MTYRLMRSGSCADFWTALMLSIVDKMLAYPKKEK